MIPGGVIRCHYFRKPHDFTAKFEELELEENYVASVCVSLLECDVCSS